jgi:hypothetical protein
MMAGVDLVHVPYRGSAPALTDLMGGQCAGDVWPAELVDPICQDREATCARGIERVTFGCAAGHSDARQFLAGLRGDRLIRHRSAQEHAGRDHRQVEQGDQRGHRGRQDQGAAGRIWRPANADDPADFGTFIAKETEKWGKVVKFSGANMIIIPLMGTRTGRPSDAPIPLCLCETPASTIPPSGSHAGGMAPNYLSPRLVEWFKCNRQDRESGPDIATECDQGIFYSRCE